MKKHSKTDLARIDEMTDEVIDDSDIPPLTKAFFSKAKLRMPEPKAVITMRVDTDVLNWFKRQGKGYQSRMNAVLRMFVEAQKQQRTRSSS